jgi:hypothetical protein
MNLDAMQWRPSVVKSIFGYTSASEILKLRILNDPNTQYIWTPSTSGKFSISSAYTTLIQSHPPLCSPWSHQPSGNLYGNSISMIG